jgi:hypothetical protein
MSEYTIDAEADAVTLAAGDEFDVFQASTGRIKKATMLEVNTYVASTGLPAAAVNTTATTLTVTAAAHGNRVVTISSAAPIAITLPQATGTGTTYKFQMQVAATGTVSTIKVANATDVMQGIVFCLITATPFAENFGTSATSDTISMDGSTLGGVVGDVWEIQDVKTGFFSVRGYTAPTGTKATPFSATV